MKTNFQVAFSLNKLSCETPDFFFFNVFFFMNSLRSHYTTNKDELYISKL